MHVQEHPLSQVMVPKNGAFGKLCLCPSKKKGFLTKTAKMTNLRSSQWNKGFAAQTASNDENHENGGCHEGKEMVYQRHRCLFPEQDQYENNTP